MTIKYAPVAQLDRAFGYEPKGREFESLRARHLKRKSPRALFCCVKLMLTFVVKKILKSFQDDAEM